MTQQNIEEVRLELTRLIGEKGIEYIEGCQAGSKECGKKNREGKFICKHCNRWNGPDRQEIKYTPATLSDFHRYANDKHFKWKQEADVIYYARCSSNTTVSGKIPYNSSLSLLDQDEEILKQIVSLVKET